MATKNVVNRGAQARDTEIINTELDMDTSEMSRQPTDNSSANALSDRTASYVQVIVQKHRRARLPAASSPAASPPAKIEEAGALPAAVLMACPALAALQSVYGGVARGLETGAEPTRGGGDEGQKSFEKQPSKSIFKREYSSSDDEADEVEVLQLERVSEALVARGGRGGRGGVAGRAARRVRRRGARLLAALLTPPRLLLDLPVALLLHLERCALEVVRGAVVDGAAVAADALGKPALAGAHNALTALAAAAAGVARGLREALRPLAGVLLDATEPVARVVAALRLVHVQHVHCRCRTPPEAV